MCVCVCTEGYKAVQLFILMEDTTMTHADRPKHDEIHTGGEKQDQQWITIIDGCLL